MRRPPKGRGAGIQPVNPYLNAHCSPDLEHVEPDDEYLDRLGRPATEYHVDHSASIVAENDSPDVGFRYSINPYRGCSHGCSYCYARPTHEYLGLSAGLDFETKIMVKLRAPELFREWLAEPGWHAETIAFSGVTDCYQPAEREYRITRGCIEVAAECRQPIGIITKNALVTRDLDLLAQLARDRAVRVCLSITTLDPSLARNMEPRTSAPTARLRAIAELTAAGIPTHLMLAPLIPGLNDSEIPAILTAAREAGATSAGYVLVRLPTTVRPVFLEWLGRTYPDRSEKVQSLLRLSRGGKLNDSTFGRRQIGIGNFADILGETFKLWHKKLGYAEESVPLNRGAFRPPRIRSGQLRMF